MEANKVYRCKNCGQLLADVQVRSLPLESGRTLLVCPHDGETVFDYTHTPRGEVFLESFNRQGQEVRNASSI